MFIPPVQYVSSIPIMSIRLGYCSYYFSFDYAKIMWWIKIYHT